MHHSPPGSSVHGILQARTLEWVAMPSSRESSQPRDWTDVSYLSLLHWKAGSWVPPCSSDGKESACNVGDLGSIPESGRFPWRRKWQPTPVFLPGESHGRRSLAGYSPWGFKELDTTEQLTREVGRVCSNPSSATSLIFLTTTASCFPPDLFTDK